MKLLIASLLPILVALLSGCQAGTKESASDPKSGPRSACEEFLGRYATEYRRLKTAANEADWISQTHIVEGDPTNEKRTRTAEGAMAAFAGSTENIEKTRGFLAHEAELSALATKELKAILFNAGSSPQTAKDLVDAKIAAETKQIEKLYGFKFELDGKEITPNEIDAGLEKEKDLAARQKIWEASKTVGIELRPGL